MLLAAAVTLAGCGGSKSGDSKVSVFKIQPGECFNPPSAVKVELSKLSKVPCDRPHTEEAYASVAFVNADGSDASAYPGDAKLKTFADGACAQRYTGYVGKDYLDSSYFFTYLLPSARGWEQPKDRAVLCFVTTTGELDRVGQGHQTLGGVAVGKPSAVSGAMIMCTFGLAPSTLTVVPMRRPTSRAGRSPPSPTSRRAPTSPRSACASRWRTPWWRRRPPPRSAC